jgi:hypothetical protein
LHGVEQDAPRGQARHPGQRPLHACVTPV